MDCSPPVPWSMGFSRQEYWSGLPCPFPGNLPDPGIEPWSPALQADSLSSEPCWAALLQYPNLNTRSHTEVLEVQSGDCWASLRFFHRVGEVEILSLRMLSHPAFPRLYFSRVHSGVFQGLPNMGWHHHSTGWWSVCSCVLGFKVSLVFIQNIINCVCVCFPHK